MGRPSSKLRGTANRVLLVFQERGPLARVIASENNSEALFSPAGPLPASAEIHLSPGLEALTTSNLLDFFRGHGVASILDARCGDGEAVDWLLRRYGDEFRIHGFDEAGRSLTATLRGLDDTQLTTGCLWYPNDLPRGFDAVFCANGLEAVPHDHIDDALSAIYRSTEKAAFFAIGLLRSRDETAALLRPLPLHSRPIDWWIERIQAAGFRIESQAIAPPVGERTAQLYLAVTPLRGRSHLR